MSKQYIYTITDLTKKHGPHEVLKEIHLAFYPGAKIGVLGRNGSGKSTVLDALTFVLFSKPFRKINKPQVVNTINGSGTIVEIEFNIVVFISR